MHLASLSAFQPILQPDLCLRCVHVLPARLWSCFPYMRPLGTITHETIQYGIDKDGASVHDVIGSRWGELSLLCGTLQYSATSCAALCACRNTL